MTDDVIGEEAWPTLVGFSREILNRAELIISNIRFITVHGLNEGHIATYTTMYICYSVSDDQQRSTVLSFHR